MRRAALEAMAGKDEERRRAVVSGRNQIVDVNSSAPRDPSNLTGDHDR